jgi:hypothetical protein
MADAAQSQAIEWGSAEAANLSWLDELSASLLSASSSAGVGVGGGGGRASSSLSLALGSTSASTSTAAAAASSTNAPHGRATLPRESSSTHGCDDAVIATLLAQRAALDDALLANAALQKGMLAAVKGARGARAELRELVVSVCVSFLGEAKSHSGERSVTREGGGGGERDRKKITRGKRGEGSMERE